MKPKRMPILELFSKWKISRQLYAMYVLAVLGPILLIGTILIGYTANLLTDYYINLLESDNLRVKTILFEITTQTYKISEEIAFDNRTQVLLDRKDQAEIEQEDSEQLTAGEVTMLDQISLYETGHAEIENITIYADYPEADAVVNMAYADEEIQKQGWYQHAIGSSEVFWEPIKTIDKYGNEYWNLALVRQIAVTDSDVKAVLVIRLSDNYLRTRIDSSEYRINTSCDNGIIIYDSERKHYGEQQKLDINYEDYFYQYRGTVWEDVKNIFVSVSTLNFYQSQSKLYVVVMNEHAYYDIRAIVMGSLLIILIAAGIPGFLIHYFTKYFTNRVSILRDQMKKVANEEYDDNPIFGGEDELSETYEDLQLMAKKIKKKDAIMYETILAEQRLANEQQMMEMKMLASQINPHFLYNTLESIRMQAITAGNRQVANSIKLLGKTMRYVLSNTGTTMVAMSKELGYVENYLQIQQIRFGDRVNYKINNPEELDIDEIGILPLLIQPIAENAVLHGLEQTEHGMITIDLSTDEHGDNIRIVISDNGCGMAEERLLEVRESIEKEAIQKKNSIALSNIQHRIRLFYGKSYGLRIDSTVNVGTVITMTLPKQTVDMTE